MRGKINNIELVYEQGSSALNEDSLTCSDNLFGVFDGASSLVSDRYLGKTGAWWASRLVSQEFSRNDSSLFELGSRANKKLQLQMTAMGVESSDRLKSWSTSAAVCRLQDDSIEWLQSGDCQILAIEESGACRLLTSYHNHDRETLQKWQQLLADNTPQPREALHPQLVKVRRQMNSSYGALNGEQAALDFFQTGSCSLAGIAHLLIFTDGLFPPGENPAEEPDFCWLADYYQQGGLEKVKQEIRKREKHDPECRRYPRFKMHDDIAAVAISFQQ
ncbi:Protein phosphatase 2C [Malonomonas rubra DSM 5091]|uniref:Protein phosphatase 2C n=1 Tax=Malonomonas rubra DSM 5091 TaxID=1122189 RepID=A0A1M6K1A4_MALRU|nr:protein phosphatase 2C domain-containing protein [Malonomonas rubra]SHJ52729.1 Protein phosphatase 2C [Malonomonas rubra DSM 5091]